MASLAEPQTDSFVVLAKRLLQLGLILFIGCLWGILASDAYTRDFPPLAETDLGLDPTAFSYFFRFWELWLQFTNTGWLLIGLIATVSFVKVAMFWVGRKFPKSLFAASAISLIFSVWQLWAAKILFYDAASRSFDPHGIAAESLGGLLVIMLLTEFLMILLFGIGRFLTR